MFGCGCPMAFPGECCRRALCARCVLKCSKLFPIDGPTPPLAVAELTCPFCRLTKLLHLREVEFLSLVAFSPLGPLMGVPHSDLADGGSA